MNAPNSKDLLLPPPSTNPSAESDILRDVAPGGQLYPWANLILDERVPLGEVWIRQPNGRIDKLVSLRRECPFDNNNCQLGMGHPGHHLVPWDFNDWKRGWAVISQEGAFLRVI